MTACASPDVGVPEAGTDAWGGTDTGSDTLQAGAVGDPMIVITAPLDGSTLTHVTGGTPLEIDVAVSNATVAPGGAFAVRYLVDGVALADTDTVGVFTVDGLQPGAHHIAVRLVAADGSALPNAESLDGLHVYVSASCGSDADCDTGLTCHAARCEAGACQFEAAADCCDVDLECGVAGQCVDAVCEQDSGVGSAAVNPNQACCSPGPEPGCQDQACEDLVCAGFGITECCTVAWDEVCAGVAVDYCPDFTGTYCANEQPPGGGGGGAEPGDCCTATPGAMNCTNTECSQQVCLIDPSCCQVEYTDACAELALGACAHCGSGGGGDDCCSATGAAGCNDDTCATTIASFLPGCLSNWDSTCAEQANQICDVCLSGGGGGSGDCCADNGSAGCDNSTCQTDVCGIPGYDYCCSTYWDGECGAIASSVCSVCSGSGTGSCCADNGSAGCESGSCETLVCAEPGLDYCCTIYWDAACGAKASELCTECGGGVPQEDCCTGDGSTGTAGCNDVACQEQVCVIEPICCEYQWDAFCTQIATQECSFCGGQPGGDCCSQNFSPSCADAECSETVCAADPTCCEGPWNAACAELAIISCGACGSNGPDCCSEHPFNYCNDSLCQATVCAADPSCCDVAWTQSCTDIAAQNCAVCGGSADGDCCSTNFTPGCEDPACTATVCEIDASCCEVQWGFDCAFNYALQYCDACGGDPKGNCCDTNLTPSCNDQTCADAVCEMNPSCCDVEWTAACANLALIECNTCGGSPGGTCCAQTGLPGCTDGSCQDLIVNTLGFTNCQDVWDASCAALAGQYCTTCGGTPTGGCCEVHGGTGCSDSDCELSVCTTEPFCCDTAWDEYCVFVAGQLCEVCGGTGSTNDCCAPTDIATPGCNDGDCDAYVCGIAPTCCQVQWDSLCAEIAQAECTVCGGTQGGDCCDAGANFSPGCADQGCNDLVCSLDPTCCDQNWTQACATLAGQVCGVCGATAGSCCEAGVLPGCDDQLCQTEVCAINADCCNLEWTQECADLAGQACAVCDGSSDLGSCCLPGTVGGCTDTDCQASVCAVDDICCTIQWDQNCADLATQFFCTQLCSGIECGDGTCSGPDEDCSNCPDDCGSCNGFCGDGLCDSQTENVENCSPDCVVTCGDGICSPSELDCSCVTDCAPAADDTTCDGIDDDCNGLTDDGFVATPTSCGIGACAANGFETCLNGVVADTCSPGQPAPLDATCDQTDDDCDGELDEDYVGPDPLCGGSGEGPCCEAHLGASCGEPACADSVCAWYPDCCTNEWTFACAYIAFNICDACGSPDSNLTCASATCIDDVCADDPTLCGEAWDDTTARGVLAAECPSCGGMLPDGPCCESNATGGCWDTDCSAAVCATNPDCCASSWDQSGVCAAIAQSQCTLCATPGTCCGANGSAGCESTSCSDLVCADLPECCSGTWTQACADRAAVVCNECGGDPLEACEPIALNDTTCDNVDDDCDGLFDEDVAEEPVDCGQGACLDTGTRACVDGAFVDSCTPLAPIGPDTNCDGVDDDCDGVVDDDYPVEATTCGDGVCNANGVQTCVDGAVVDTCVAGAGVADDTCDGLDNDCDGQTDEDYVASATSCGSGPCAATGTLTCSAGTLVDTCEPAAPVATDDNCDGIDDDCDGVEDDEYPSQATTCGVGVCAATGTTACIAGAVVNDCSAGSPLGASDASCDGIDDNCDGSIDEDGSCTAQIACRDLLGGAPITSCLLLGTVSGDTWTVDFTATLDLTPLGVVAEVSGSASQAGAGEPVTWCASASVAADLGALDLRAGTNAQVCSDGAATTVTLDGDLVLGDIVASFSGELQIGTTWQLLATVESLSVIPGFLTIDTATVLLDSTDGSVSVEGDLTLATLGLTVSVQGDWNQANPDAPISGCLTGMAEGTFSLGFADITDAEFQVCRNADGGHVTYEAASVLIGGGTFTAVKATIEEVDGKETTTLELGSGPFFLVDLEDATLVMVAGEAGGLLEATVVFTIGGQTLRAKVDGAYDGTDFSLDIATVPGTVWRPIPALSDLLFTSVSGSLARTAGVTTVSLSVSLDASGLDAFGAVSVKTGTIEVDLNLDTDAWTLSADFVVSLPVFGDISVVGLLNQPGAGQPLSGCLSGSKLGTVSFAGGLVGIVNPAIDVCIIDDNDFTLEVSGSVEVFGGTWVLPSASITIGTEDGQPEWQVVLTIPTLEFQGFSGGGTITVTGKTIGSEDAEPLTIEIDLVLSFSEGASTLSLGVTGTFTSADYDLAISLQDSWTPFDGIAFTVTTATGTWSKVGSTTTVTLSATTDSDLELVPGITLVGTTLDASVTLGGAWAFSLSGTVTLPALGALTIAGSLAQAGAGEPLTGCLNGSLTGPIDVLGLLQLSDLSAGVCVDAEGAVDITLGGTVTVFGGTHAFPGGEINLGTWNGSGFDGWSVAVDIPSFTLGGFTLESGRISVTDGGANIAITASMNLDVAGSLLAIDVTGAWSSDGSYSLTVALQDGETWEPFSGFPSLSFTELSGSIDHDGTTTTISVTGSAEGSLDLGGGLEFTAASVTATFTTGGEWAVGFSATVDLPIFGELIVSGNLSQAGAGEPLLGCLSAIVAGDTAVPISVPVTIQSANVEVCFEPGDVTVVQVSGQVTIFGTQYTLPESTLTLGTTWTLELALPEFTIAGFTMTSGRVLLEKNAAQVQVNAEFSVTLFDATVSLEIAGGYSDGDIDFTLSLTEAATWDLGPGLPSLTIESLTGSFTGNSSDYTVTFSAAVTGSVALTGDFALTSASISASYSTAGGWAISLGGSATVPFVGEVVLLGELAQAGAGQPITGCFAGTVVGDIVLVTDVLTVTAPTITACYDDAGAVTITSDGGSVTVLGSTVPLPSATFTKDGADWALELTMGEFALGPFTFNEGSLRVLDGAANVELNCLMTLDVGGTPLSLRAVGSLTGGDWSFALTMESGTWQPIASFTSLVFTELSGSVSSTAGVYAATVSASATIGVELVPGLSIDNASVSASWNSGGEWSFTLGGELTLPVLGSVSIAGTVAQDESGAVTGCFGGTVNNSFDLLGLGVVTITNPGAQVCVDAEGLYTISISGDATVVGQPVAFPDGEIVLGGAEGWSLSIDIGSFTIGGFTMNSGTFRVTEGGTNVYLSADYSVTLDGSVMNMVVEGTYESNGDFSLSAAMKPGTSWTPATLTDAVVFDQLSGSFASTSGVVTFTFDASAQTDINVADILSLSSVGISGEYTAGDWSLQVTAGLVLPIIGQVDITASFSKDNGEGVTLDCVSATAVGPIAVLDGIASLRDVTVERCVNDPIIEITFGGFVTIFDTEYDLSDSGRITMAAEGTTPAWTFEFDLPTMEVGDFTLTGLTVLIEEGGDSFAFQGGIQVDNVLGSTLALEVDGTYTSDGDYSFTIAQPTGFAWSPVGAWGTFTLDTATGTLERTDGVVTFSMTVSASGAATIAEGFTFTGASLTLVYSDGDWLAEFSASATVPFLNNIALNGDLEHIDGVTTGCVTGTFSGPATILDTVTFSNAAITVCLAADSTWTTTFSADVQVFGGSHSALTGYIAFGPGVDGGWEFLINLPAFDLNGFSFNGGTIVAVDGGTAMALTAGATFAIGDGLEIEVNGTYIAGNFSLTVAMKDGTTWMPFDSLPALNFDALGGTFSSIGGEDKLDLEASLVGDFDIFGGLTIKDITVGAELIGFDGAWTFSFSGDAVLPVLGDVNVSGSVTQAAPGERVSGCLTGTLTGDRDVLGLMTLRNLAVTVCMAVDGTITVTFDGEVDAFGSTYPVPDAVLTIPNGDDVVEWELEVSIANFTLGAFTLTDAKLVVQESGSKIELTANIELDIAGQVVGIAVAGDYDNGDFSLTVGLQDGTTWTPLASFPSLTFTELSGTFTRTGGLYGFSLSATATVGLELVDGLTIDNATIGANWAEGGNWGVSLSGTVTLPVVGAIVISGNVNEDAGEITGCFSVTKSGAIDVLGLMTLQSPGVELCLVSGGLYTIGITGDVDVLGSTYTFPEGEIVIGAGGASDWSLSVNIPSFTLGGFTLTSGVFTVEDGGTSFSIAAQFSVEIAGDTVTMDLLGSYQTNGDFSLSVTMTDGLTWQPLSTTDGDITFDTLTGTFSRTSGVVSFSFNASVVLGLGSPVTDVLLLVTYDGAADEWNIEISTGLVLPIIGPVQITGSFTSTDGGGLQLDCLSLTAESEFQIVDGVASMANITAEQCQNAGGKTVTFSGDLTIFENTYTLDPLGTIEWADAGSGSWTFTLTLPTMSIGDFTLNNADLVIAEGDETNITFDAAFEVELLGSTLALDLAGDYNSDGSHSFTLSQQDGFTWTPIAAFGSLTFDTVTGTYARTAEGVITLDITVSVAGSVDIAEGTTLTGVSIVFTYDSGASSFTASLTASGTFPVVGATTISGNVEKTGAEVSGSLTATMSGPIDVFGVVTLTNVDLGLTISADGSFSVGFSTDLSFDGQSFTGLSATFTYGSGTWDLAIVLPAFSVGGIALDSGSINVTNGGSNINLAATLTLSVGSSLTLDLTGAYSSGDFELTVSMADGSTWVPTAALPDLEFTTLTGYFRRTAGEMSFGFTAELGLDYEIVSGLTLQQVGATAERAGDGSWSASIHGTLSIQLGDSVLLLDIEAEANSSGEFTFTGTLNGSIEPMASVVGDGNFVLTNATVSVTVSGGSWAIEVTADAAITVLGTTFNLNAAVGVNGGSSTAVWARGTIPSLDLGGLGTIDNLAFAMSTGTISGFDIFNTPADASDDILLKPGFTLMASATSPYPLTEDEGPLIFSFTITGPDKWEARAQLPYVWRAIEPGDFDAINYLDLGPLTLFARQEGVSFEFGMGGTATFQPSNQATPVTGNVEIYLTTFGELGISLSLEGRWQDCFGLDNFAIQNFGFSIELLLSSGVPVPTSIGFNGDIFWKKSGSWPASGDDLTYAPSNILKVGASFYYSKNVSSSGLCFAGACLPLPPILFRVDVQNFELSDFIGIANDIKDGIDPLVGDFLPDADIPAIDFSPFSLSINKFIIYASTHNLELFGGTFPAGFRVEIDVEMMGRTVFFEGYLDKKGLRLNGRMSPIFVLGVALVKDPFDQFAQLSGSSLSIPGDGRLGATKTVEFWANGKCSFVSGAYSISASGSKVAVSVGGHTATTTADVLESGKNHIAVVFNTDGADIIVNGARADVERTGSAASPGSGALTVGSGCSWVDDVRFWSSYRDASEIAGDMGGLSPLMAASGNGDLIAWYDMTYDDEGNLYNERHYETNPEGLHGSYNGGAAPLLDTSDQDLYFKLQLLMPPDANPLESGIWFGAGLSVDIPLLDLEFKVGASLQLGGGSAAGTFRATPIPFLIVPFIGDFVVTGNGPNLEGEDFDDGLFGSFDLTNFTFAATAAIEFQAANPTYSKRLGEATFFFGCPLDETCDGVSDYVLDLDATIDLLFDAGPAGDVGIQGNLKWNTDDGVASVDGKLVIADHELLSGAIEITTEHISLNAMLDLPVVAGVDMGQTTVDMKLEFDPFQFTAKGEHTLTIPFIETTVTGLFEFGIGQENYFTLQATLENLTIAGYGLQNAIVRISTVDGILVEADFDLGIVSGRLEGSLTSTSFLLAAEINFQLFGYQILGASVEFSNSGFTVSFNLDLLGNTLAVLLSVDSEGNFTFSTQLTLNILGWELLNADLTITNDGIWVSVAFDFTAGSGATSTGISGQLEGYITSDFNFSLEASATIQVVGFTVADGFIKLSNTGFAVSGTVNTGVINVTFAGKLETNGNYEFKGSAALSLVGYTLASAQFTFSNSGLSISASIDVGPIQASISGSYSSDGTFELSGTAAVTVAGFSFGVTATLNNSGLRAVGYLSIPGFASFKVTANVGSDGSFEFTGTMKVQINGFTLTNAAFTLSNTGAAVSVYVNVGIFRATVEGSVQTNGNFSFFGTATISVPVPGGSFDLAGASLTVAKSGSSYTFKAQASLSLFGTSVALEAEVTNSGWSFSGEATLGIGPYTLASADVLISSTQGLSVTANLDIIVATVEVVGVIRPDFSFSFRTEVAANVAFAGISGTARVSFTRTSGGTLTLSGQMSVDFFSIATASVSFSVNSSLAFSFQGDVSVGKRIQYPCGIDLSWSEGIALEYCYRWLGCELHIEGTSSGWAGSFAAECSLLGILDWSGSINATCGRVTFDWTFSILGKEIGFEIDTGCLW